MGGDCIVHCNKVSKPVKGCCYASMTLCISGPEIRNFQYGQSLSLSSPSLPYSIFLPPQFLSPSLGGLNPTSAAVECGVRGST